MPRLTNAELKQEDGWHFPYFDVHKKRHEIIVQADNFEEALERAVAQFVKEADDAKD